MPGPIPNRSEDLSRVRDANRSERPTLKSGVLREVHIPDADPDWHPLATRLWEGMVSSGQADFFQNSDWALAYSLMEDLTRYKEPHANKDTGELYFKRSGQMLQVIMSTLSTLMVTEGDRRRLRIELSQPEIQEEPASVTAIADYRKALGTD